ncbi:hypothetical protein HCH54_007133 [Aspergillus fumigatus]
MSSRSPQGRSPRRPMHEMDLEGRSRRSMSPRGGPRSVSRSPSAQYDNGRRNKHRSRSWSRSPSRSRTSSLSRSRSPSRDSRWYRNRSYSRTPSPSSGPPRSSKIIVEKLTKNVTTSHLREIFGSFGDIKSLELPMNRTFMTNRGTAYILYHDPADAEAAVSHMHEAQLDGAVLNVSIVLPRRAFSRSPPPAENGRGGSGRRRYDYKEPPDHRSSRIPPNAPRTTPPRKHGRSRPMERHDLYRPRSLSRSRSRRRSLSSFSDSRSRSPARRRAHIRVDSPRHRKRRSPSYSSYGYSSHSDEDRSRSRSRSRVHRLDASRK